MRRRLASLLQRLKRSRAEDAGVAASDPRADELRRKLAESRALVEERDTFESAEPTVDQTEHAPDDPERRRRDVHEAARAVTREMRQG